MLVLEFPYNDLPAGRQGHACRLAHRLIIVEEIDPSLCSFIYGISLVFAGIADTDEDRFALAFHEIHVRPGVGIDILAFSA